jgi:hypothetical protein
MYPRRWFQMRHHWSNVSFLRKEQHRFSRKREVIPPPSRRHDEVRDTRAVNQVLAVVNLDGQAQPTTLARGHDLG